MAIEVTVGPPLATKGTHSLFLNRMARYRRTFRAAVLAGMQSLMTDSHVA